MRITDELISVKDAAKESRRNMETVRRWIWAGKLPAQKLGNQLFIKRDDWENFLGGMNKQKNDRFRFIEQAMTLQEKIRARTRVEFDISALIEESRKGVSHE
ncbi:MAG: helix-turn-helix domain-containing protein [Chloroflexota bacterium]